jgi:hypothetical protein
MFLVNGHLFLGEMREIEQASMRIERVVMEIPELLAKARKAIESGETSLREAAEAVASAQQQGATQRQIASAVGKSAAWVNRLLQWRARGYEDGTAFGPQARAARQRLRVQATKHYAGPASSLNIRPLAIEPGRIRPKLIKALGMLGSEHSGERASAAYVVEALRHTLGRGWDEIIVPDLTAGTGP